ININTYITIIISTIHLKSPTLKIPLKNKLIKPTKHETRLTRQISCTTMLSDNDSPIVTKPHSSRTSALYIPHYIPGEGGA
ncbi:hypothetical protein, partial [Blautia sp. AF13-16]|uniref:hypothetical protein n=1 Tax=Blautia sp. AF13-16 TaxID=2292195 RepID=UPI001A9AAB72